MESEIICFFLGVLGGGIFGAMLASNAHIKAHREYVKQEKEKK